MARDRGQGQEHNTKPRGEKRGNMQPGDIVKVTGNERLGGDHRGRTGTIVRPDPNSSWGKSWYVLLQGYTVCLSFLESELTVTGHVSDEPEAFGVFPSARKYLPENREA